MDMVTSGSIDGDPPAAYRYTEVRMSKIAEKMLEDIEKETVDFRPNFDDRLVEPTVLPTRIPQLLINGGSGIAVGMASNIPPHNLREVIAATIAYIDNKDITIKELMQYIKGPDFPTGAMILGVSGIEEAYNTGRGKLIMRGEASIEQVTNSKQRIIISSLPYQVNKAKLIENIAELVKDKKIEGISDIRDESDRDASVRVTIELKRDANPQLILNLLYKHTQLQSTFGVINLALVNNQPKILNLKDSIEIFVSHRKEVIIRSAYDDAKERLMKRFDLTDIQAQAILDMRLKTLTGLQIEKIEAEYNELLKIVAELKAILASDEKQYQIIKEELNEVQEKFGNDRLTKIIPSQDEISLEDLIKEEQSVIALTHLGYIKRMPASTYKSQHRGGKGITGMATRDEDFVKELFTASTHDNILFFTNKGKVYQLKGYDIPEASRIAKGTAIINLLPLDSEEKVEVIMPINKFEDDYYLLMSTTLGMIKKTKLTEYSSVRKSGIIAINLKDDDKLIDVKLTNGNSKIILVTRNGKAITFEETDVRETGRSSQGVIGIKLIKDDTVIGMDTYTDLKDNTLLAITESGFGKRTELEEYRIQKRGGTGVLTYNITKKTGNLVGTKIVNGNEDLMLITNEGTIIRIKVESISILSRATQGVTLIKTTDSSKVVSIETIESEEDLIEEEEN